ncbi:MAG TPA: 5-aminolevulinate synthase, partial [Chitinophagales bacterium]|nr:5-aminolevulinate synthase [Chitinophagales bacterium]
MNDYYKDIINQKLSQLKQQGNYRYFQDVNKSARHFPRFYYDDENQQKKSAINWCSNDYLCMSIHEDIISKLSFTAHHSGVGSSGTRNISGTTSYHKQLEQAIAGLHNREAAIIFNSAFLANLSTLATIGRSFPGLVFISDERNHASIIEGIKSSGCAKQVFRHNDVQHLEEILASLPANQPKLIVFESIYSISGNVAPIEKITALAEKYNALTYVDEVHAVGLYNSNGAGVVASLQLQNQVDIINGTFAKAFGTLGGYVTADADMIDYLRSFASGFIFTTSLPPAVCAATIRSIELVEQNDGWRSSFHAGVAQLRNLLQQSNVPFHTNA